MRPTSKTFQVLALDKARDVRWDPRRARVEITLSRALEARQEALPLDTPSPPLSRPRQSAATRSSATRSKEAPFSARAVPSPYPRQVTPTRLLPLFDSTPTSPNGERTEA